MHSFCATHYDSIKAHVNHVGSAHTSSVVSWLVSHPIKPEDYSPLPLSSFQNPKRKSSIQSDSPIKRRKTKTKDMDSAPKSSKAAPPNSNSPEPSQSLGNIPLLQATPRRSTRPPSPRKFFEFEESPVKRGRQSNKPDSDIFFEQETASVTEESPSRDTSPSKRITRQILPTCHRCISKPLETSILCHNRSEIFSSKLMIL